MKTTRKIGLIPVILLCAAFALVPMVAAQGNSQRQGDFSQGPSQGGSMNQGQCGQGGMMMPDNGQTANQGTNNQDQGNAAVPHGPPVESLGNMTGPGPDVNMNTNNGTWSGPGNMAMNNMTFGPQHFDSNVTADNNWTTPNAVPMGWGPNGGNLTGPEDNLTAPNPMGGNMTLPQAPPNNGNANGLQNQNGQNAGTATPSVQQQGSSMSQAQGQDQKDNTLIEEFLAWLRGGQGSSS